MARKKRATIDHDQVRELLVTNHPMDGKRKNLTPSETEILVWRNKVFKAYKGKQGKPRPTAPALKKVIREGAKAILVKGAVDEMQDFQKREPFNNPIGPGDSPYDSPPASDPPPWVEAAKRAQEAAKEAAGSLDSVRTMLGRYEGELRSKEETLVKRSEEIGVLEARIALLRERTIVIQAFLNDPDTVTICDWLKEQQSS